MKYTIKVYYDDKSVKNYYELSSSQFKLIKEEIVTRNKILKKKALSQRWSYVLVNKEEERKFNMRKKMLLQLGVFAFNTIALLVLFIMWIITLI